MSPVTTVTSLPPLLIALVLYVSMPATATAPGGLELVGMGMEGEGYRPRANLCAGFSAEPDTALIATGHALRIPFVLCPFAPDHAPFTESHAPPPFRPPIGP